MSGEIIGIAGSLGQPSRTLALVTAAVDRAAARFGRTSVVHDLADFGPSLGQARRLSDLGTRARTIVDRIIAADALVVGTPVYKGGYTGIFKHLFDLLEPETLVGKPILLTATGGGEKHALVIEHHLRPLFGFFEAATLPTGIYASGADFTDAIPTSPPLIARIDRAVAQLSFWLEPAHPTAA